MPLNLDSCITGIFVPGNIGASSGQPPIVRVMPPRAPSTFEVQVHEVTAATDLTDQNSFSAALAEIATAADVISTGGIFAADLAEAASAADVQDAATALPTRSAMLPEAFINPGASRQANVIGVMVNL